MTSCDARQLLEEYVTASYCVGREVEPATEAQYLRIVRCLGKWLGRIPLVGDLNRDTINNYLHSLHRTGRSGYYRRSTRATILAIWRSAAGEGLVAFPQGIRTVSVTGTNPESWGVADVRALLRVAGSLEGSFRGTSIKRSFYWSALIRVAWDTGLRRRDLHALKTQDVSPSFHWQTQKRKKWVHCHLRQSTMLAIVRLAPELHEPIFPLWGSENAFSSAWRRIVSLAGVRPGPFKMLRKSAGTATESTRPGQGHKLLGNERKTFEEFYWDASRLGRSLSPPEL